MSRSGIGSDACVAILGEPVLAELLAAMSLLAGGVCCASLLRGAWRRPPGRLLVAAGWISGFLSTGVAAALVGPARAIPGAMALVSLGGLLVVASGASRRRSGQKMSAPPARTLASSPAEARNLWLRAAVAGPLGGLTAVGIGATLAVAMPGDAQARTVLGAGLIPVAWAAAMIWGLTDAEPWRPCCGLGLLLLATLLVFGAEAAL